MMNGIGGSGSGHAAALSSMFKKLDTDGSGKISRDEFVAGAPDDVDSVEAGSLFDKLDSKKTGALSQSDMASAFQQMASRTRGALLQSQEVGGDSERPDPSQMFGKLDTDGDGKLSKAEFTAGRPKGVSVDQANAFYDKIAEAAGNSSTDGLSQDQFASGMQAAGPGSSSGSAATGQSDQLVDQLLDALKKANSGQATSTASAQGTNDNKLMEELIKIIRSYQTASATGMSGQSQVTASLAA